MIPAALSTDALALTWAVQVGAVTWEEVIAWTDGWILKLDVLPDELVDLSLGASRPNEAWTLFRRLARRGDPDMALPLFARKLWDGLQRNQLDPIVLASRLTDVVTLSSREEPDDIRLPPPSPSFSDAAWLLFSISVERGAYGPEEEFDRYLAGEVLALLQRLLSPQQ